MKTLVLLATILAFCTTHVLAEYVLADNIFQDVMDDAGFMDEEPKKREAKGATKFSGWLSFGGKEFPMTLAADLDMENELIEGKARIEKPDLKESLSVAGTIKSNGEVKFVAFSKAEPPYTYTGMYKDGNIKGTYSIRVKDAILKLKKTGPGTWEGTLTEGQGKPSIPYKDEELRLNLDKDGKLSGTGKDHVGRFSFTGTMYSNNKAEVLLQYLHDPANKYVEKFEFNKDMTEFKGTIPAKTFHGNFELTKM